MISFDTFSGPRTRVREAELDSKGLLVLAEQPEPVPELFPLPTDLPEASDDSSDEFYESQEDDINSCDLFHEHDDTADVKEEEPDQDTKQEPSSGRIRQLVELLTLQSQNVGDARSALVSKLLGVVKVHELLLSRATEEQIANAANDAITDEIVASVDQEERRRSEIAHQLVPLQPIATSTATLFDPGHLSPFRVLELVDVLDSTTGGMVKRVLTKVRRRAPLNARMVRDNELERDVEFCSFCSAYGDHTAAQHKCRLCGVAGHHRSRNCPNQAMTTANDTNSQADSTIRAVAPVDDQKFFKDVQRLRHLLLYHGSDRRQICEKDAGIVHTAMRGGHTPPTSIDVDYVVWSETTGARDVLVERRDRPPVRTEARVRTTGMIRRQLCRLRSSSNTVLSYSVDAASKVRDRVLETIPQVLPPPAATLVWRSLDKVGDADLILRKTLQRIGVWGGGSQTPITTPYAPPSVSFSGAEASSGGTTIGDHDCEVVHRYPELESPPRSSSSSNSSAPLALNDGQSSGVYVLSYAEGSSVVPARILKYMRLLMHHEVSTNAFSVVVRFDPRPSHWELMKPGMVSPRSLPSSPTLSHQLQKRMSHYTLQTLLGARGKLRDLEATRCKLHLRLKQQEQIQTQFRAQEKQKCPPQRQ
ncbi:hypothetical protein V7S43_005321 [Phytophthora oleae]|uniref:CCHC-type domain-containing protein n=1 Tax=Phytophthora oleae TaxID=2107226 RepID=A0ABD3FSN4_9STRA